MKAADRALGSALIALGAALGAAVLLIGGPDGEWGPRIVPLLAVLTLAGAGLALLRAAPSAAPREAAGGGGRVAALLGVAILYVAAIDRVGYLVATALAAPAAFALFGVRGALPLLAAAVAAPLALHVVFFRVLGVFPPLGAWFDLLDHLPL